MEGWDSQGAMRLSMPTEYVESSLKEAYKDEWDRLHKLDAVTAFTGAVIIGLIGSTLYFVQHMAGLAVNFLLVLFSILLLASVLTLIGRSTT